MESDNYTKIHYSGDMSADKVWVKNQNKSLKNVVFSRLSDVGADDGISARGGLSRQTVHRTVWCYAQIAKQFSPYFKSRQKQKKHNLKVMLALFGADDGI